MKTAQRNGKNLATVVIDIDDVRRAGSVEKAIHAFCERSDTVSSGVVGMAFATSGPGTGWSKQYGVDEWSREAFNGGALAYVDADDGRVRRALPYDPDDDNAGGAVHTDIGGGEYLIGDWSAESEVYVKCPSEEDALAYPELAAEMAQAVKDYHYALSDVTAWKDLVELIRAAAMAFDGLDGDDFPRGDE